MLPRPRFLALIALEAVERDDERSLRTLRAKAGVDVVELARGGGHRHGGGHALREAVVIGRSEEHTSELQSLMRISYAVFCLNKKNNIIANITCVDVGLILQT